MYLQNNFTEEYEPTVLDIYSGTKNVNNKELSLEIHDTSGDEHLGTNRKAQYQNADVFAICVAANNRESYDHIAAWKAEIESVEPGKPICLILTKIDLLDDTDEYQQVTKSLMITKKKDNGFVNVSSTSSKEWQDYNVHKAFVKIIESAYSFKYNPKKDSP